MWGGQPQGRACLAQQKPLCIVAGLVGGAVMAGYLGIQLKRTYKRLQVAKKMLTTRGGVGDELLIKQYRNACHSFYKVLAGSGVFLIAGGVAGVVLASPSVVTAHQGAQSSTPVLSEHTQSNVFIEPAVVVPLGGYVTPPRIEPNAGECEGWEIDLVNAASGNDIAALRRGLSPARCLMYPDEVRRALSVALSQGPAEVVDVFIDSGLACADSDSITPLYEAIDQNNLAAVTALLERGDAVKDLNRPAPSSGRVPLLLAVSRKNTEIVRLLLKYGPDQDAINKAYDKVKSDLEWLRYEEKEYAVEKEIIELLCAAGARSSAQTDFLPF